MSAPLAPFKKFFSKRALLRLVQRLHGWFPFTWLSLVLMAVMYWVWYGEVSAHANQILFSAVIVWCLAFCTIVSVTFLSTLLVVWGTRAANKRVVLVEDNEVGAHIASDYAVFVPFFMPFLTVDVDLQHASLTRHEQRRGVWAREWLEPQERGRFHALRRRITVGDIFGLTRISFELSQPVQLVVQPASNPYEMKAFHTRTSGDGYSHPEGDPRGELIEMRRYQAGDPLRFVLWKVFARSRKLVVRAPEPALVEEKDMFVYYVCGRNDEASASMARSFLNGLGQGLGKELCFAADGAKRLVANAHEGIEDLIDSVEHRAHGGKDLLAVAPFVSQGAMAHCFLLVPAQLGSWIESVRQFVATYPIRPTFVVSVNASAHPDAPKNPGLLRRILCHPHPDALDFDAQMRALKSELETMGSVRIVDVSTGAMVEHGA